MFSHRVSGLSAVSPPTGARLRIWAKPGSRRNSIRWDPWRERWTVAVTAPAVRGAANTAILLTLAERLGVEPTSLRWIHSGTGAAKEVEVVGLSIEEAARRLVRAPGGRS